jgi:prevent-host-death family protein
MCAMKKVSIREVQHNFGEVLRCVEEGATVYVTRRKVPVARLLPVHAHADDVPAVDWRDHARRLHAIWGARRSQVNKTDAVLADLRGER